MSKFDLETIRHSAAHVMAAAVKQLYPDARFDIGPATENGFYYDFDMEHRLVAEDLKEIEIEIDWHRVIKDIVIRNMQDLMFYNGVNMDFKDIVGSLSDGTPTQQ